VPAEPSMDALVGSVLEGAYRITRLIGEGGMARCTRRCSFGSTSACHQADGARSGRQSRSAGALPSRGRDHVTPWPPPPGDVIDFGQADLASPTW